MAKVNCRLVDGDEVVITYSDLGEDCDGDPIEDIELRVAVYSDTESLEVSVTNRADSRVVTEFVNQRDITLRFDDVPNPFTDDAQGDGYSNVKCPDECCSGCDPCCACGTPARGSDLFTDDLDCHQHCECYPDLRCCDCDAVDTEW